MTNSAALPHEIPSPLDFRDPEQARAWLEDIKTLRAWRSGFIAAFAATLRLEKGPLDVLELGSGPGHLAAELLRTCDIARYQAVDFSPAMHDLARDHLAAEAGRLDFVLRDFRDEDWRQGLGPVDVIVTMQAAHEVRHRRRLAPLFAGVREIVRPRGLFLFCDHYRLDDSAAQRTLYLERDEQAAELEAAGFTDVRPIFDDTGMALLSARRP
jgi:cyclopropane fatty-acyl-phospholipid synthase-like methyltransferase